ncbi:MAG: transglutaminase family protein [Devosiaceae bacterium]|nr:transglutaminase family protein [Devosiaceae bacterium MH13]
MRTYAIRFVSRYRYSSAVESGLHLARLLPMRRDDQTIRAAQLNIDPQPARVGTSADFFGASQSWFRLDAPHTELSIEMTAEVLVSRHPNLLGTQVAWADIAPAARCTLDLGPGSPAHFLAPSPATMADPAIVSFAQTRFDASPGLLEAAGAFAKAIRAQLTYDPQATGVHTTATEAFAIKAGVCQDFAHIFIAGCRALGLPARYVSGYLRTDPPPGQPKLEGADAMHAWASVWAGDGVGWVDFDPTNGCQVLDDHIVVAVGRDYTDTAPVLGAVMGSGDQEHQVAVDVTELS